MKAYSSWGTIELETLFSFSAVSVELSYNVKQKKKMEQPYQRRRLRLMSINPLD